MPTKSIAVRVPDDLYEYLVNRAQKEHRTLSNLIISMLLDGQYLDEHDISKVFEVLEGK